LVNVPFFEHAKKIKY